MQKTRFPAVVATFIVCFAFWLLLTWSFAVQELIAGAVVSLAVALFAARFFIHEKAFWFADPLKFFSGLIYWLFIFPVELIKANLNMAKICFGGCKKIAPGIVKVPVDLKSDYGQAALANSITLTPGTITMEVAEEEGQTYYYIHWIDVTAPSGKEAGDAIKGTLEKGLRRVWE
ncbi:MAG: Na+/H+ antiporter subunit E [Oscillospiraceae bacterium]|nr:Na+/H+ antiporter subunit E [Oscillospiraceae bacterium]